MKTQSRCAAVYALLALIVLAYVGLAVGYAVTTPRWNNPDEPAHYNYIRELAETGRLPVITAGDWDADLLDLLKAARFPDDGEIDTLRYEGHQPPLYYVLGAGLYLMTAGLSMNAQVLVLKLLSILLGSVVVVAAFGAAKQVFPSWPSLALMAAATVAFLPMHTAISAAINNDSLANALAALTILQLLVGMRRGLDDRAVIVLGLLLGALLLTKLTVYAYVPLVLAVVALTERQRGVSPKPSPGWELFRRPALMLAVAAGVSGWWFTRNVLTYGWADPLVARRHAEVVVGQPYWAQIDAAAGDYFLRVVFRSFWGQFGWMGIPLDDRLYLLYLSLTSLALVGVLVAVREWLVLRSNDGMADAGSARALAVLAVATCLVFGQLVYYNLSFIQAQGRYLFPALVPMALLMSLGWCRLAGQVSFGAFIKAPGPAEPFLAAALGTVTGWALLDSAALLLAGQFWPGRWVLLSAACFGLALALAVARRHCWTRRALLPGLALALAMLNTVCLVRFLAPSFS